jgi:hypothetical protein
MQTEFRAIAHGEYGAAEDVLRLAECRFKSEELGPDDVLVQVTARPVHPGDIQILSALPQGGPVVPLPGVLPVRAAIARKQSAKRAISNKITGSRSGSSGDRI